MGTSAPAVARQCAPAPRARVAWAAASLLAAACVASLWPLPVAAASSDCAAAAVVAESPGGPLLLAAGAAGVAGVLVLVRRRRGAVAATLLTLGVVAMAVGLLAGSVAGAAETTCNPGGVLGTTTTTPAAQVRSATPDTGTHIPWIVVAILVGGGSTATAVALARRRPDAETSGTSQGTSGEGRCS